MFDENDLDSYLGMFGKDFEESLLEYIKFLKENSDDDETSDVRQKLFDNWIETDNAE